MEQHKLEMKILGDNESDVTKQEIKEFEIRKKENSKNSNSNIIILNQKLIN